MEFFDLKPVPLKLKTPRQAKKDLNAKEKYTLAHLRNFDKETFISEILFAFYDCVNYPAKNITFQPEINVKAEIFAQEILTYVNKKVEEEKETRNKAREANRDNRVLACGELKRLELEMRAEQRKKLALENLELYSAMEEKFGRTYFNGTEV